MPAHFLVDAHCHLQVTQFDADREEVIARAREGGVVCVTAGSRRTDSAAAVKLAAAHDNVYAVVGLYPTNVVREQWKAEDYEQLINSPRVVGVGEIGLDYYWDKSTPEDERAQARARQRETFQAQLAFARAHNLPAIIHCRDAFDDLLSILRETGQPKVMIHSFTGSEEDAHQLLDLGCHLSFNGLVTFKNAEPIRRVLRKVPLDRLLIETDAPYLAPVPHRGKRNEPVFVRAVAEGIASVLGMDANELMQQTAENAQQFFGISTG